jgi:hypothetical protein
LPVQVSATSHGPAAARHTVVAGKNWSAGHSVDVPVQVSATSQGPAAGRQTAPAFAGTSMHRPVSGSQTASAHGLLVSQVMHWPRQTMNGDGQAWQWPVVSQTPEQHSALERQFAPRSRHSPCSLQPGSAGGQTHWNVVESQ